MNEKVLVVHPAQQHAFYTAQALDEKGILQCLVTSLYYKRGTLLFPLVHLLPLNARTRLENRRNPLLDDNRVVVLCEWSAIIELVSQRIERAFHLRGFNNAINRWHLTRFNKAVIRYIKKESVKRIISYDNYSFHLFSFLATNGICVEKILDMSAPALTEFYKIIWRHKQVLSAKDKEYYLGKQFKVKIRDNIEEIMLADKLLCASTITSNSVLEIKKDANCIIARYGIDAVIPLIKSPSSFLSSGILKVVMVGATNLLKGYTYLVQALNRIRIDTELHCYGLIDNEYYESSIVSSAKCKIFIHGHVPQKQLIKEITSYDLLVFGSLCDGFGFGALEAIMSGVPAIISNKAGIADVFMNKLPEVVYNPYDTNQLCDSLMQCYNATTLERLQNEEMNIVNELTWKSYAETLATRI